MGLKYLYVPSGVKAGTAYGVMPNSSDADFDDFTRNSAGSRVDKNGFINTGLGLGSEEITNGDFEQGSTDWSITNTGSASSSISNGYLRIVTNGDYTIVVQGGLAIGKTYQLSYTILESDGGSLVLENPSNINLDSSVGYHTIEFYGGVTSLRLKRGGGALDVKIDNVSVREVTEVNTDVPRLDYTGGGCPSLLLEPQSTNYVVYSEDFSQGLWAKLNSTITSDTGISPDGSQNASNLSFNGASNASLRTVITSTSGQVYTFSIWIKKISANYTNNINARIEGFAGTVGVVFLGDTLNNAAVGEFVRYSVTTSASTGGTSYFQFRSDEEATFEVWGAQIENQSYVTSYTPTFGATSTRSEDVGGSTGDLSSVVNSQEGTFMFEGSFLSIGGRVGLNSSTTTWSDRITILTISDTQIKLILKGGNVGEDATFTVPNIKTNGKLAIRWIGTNVVGYYNGTQVFSKANNGGYSAGILDRISMAGANGTSNKFTGKIKQLRVYDEYLSDADIEELTSWKSFNEMAQALNYVIE